MGLIGAYSFAGHARGQGLSQFLQNEAAGGITTSEGTQKARCYRSFCRMKQLGGITTSQGTKKVRRYPSFSRIKQLGYYYFTGHPRDHALSQFWQNEAAARITTSQGTQEVRCSPRFCRIKQLGVLLLHRVPNRSGVIPVFEE